MAAGPTVAVVASQVNAGPATGYLTGWTYGLAGPVCTVHAIGAGVAAGPTVVEVGVQVYLTAIGRIAVAVREARVAGQQRAGSIGTTSRRIRETTHVSASAAVIDVLARVHAGPTAGRLTGRACEMAPPVYTGVTRWADVAACTTVIGVGARVHAGVAAGHSAGRAQEWHSWSLPRRTGRVGGVSVSECYQDKFATHQCCCGCCQACHDRAPREASCEPEPTRGCMLEKSRRLSRRMVRRQMVS